MIISRSALLKSFTTFTCGSGWGNPAPPSYVSPEDAAAYHSAPSFDIHLQDQHYQLILPPGGLIGVPHGDRPAHRTIRAARIAALAHHGCPTSAAGAAYVHAPAPVDARPQFPQLSGARRTRTERAYSDASSTSSGTVSSSFRRSKPSRSARKSRRTRNSTEPLFTSQLLGKLDARERDRGDQGGDVGVDVGAQLV